MEHFIRNSQPNSIIITRYKNLDSLDILNLIYWSNYFLDRQIPFDHNFDIVDSSSFYCSELIHYIFKKANVTLLYDNISNHNLDNLKFKIFWDDNNFEIIINHQNENFSK